jgi:hypothetical protein
MKYIYFVHIPKSAGNSIKKSFYTKYVYKNVDVFNTNNKFLNKNQSLKENINLYLSKMKRMPKPFAIDDDTIMTCGWHENIYDKIKNISPRFCFAFTRNPWDRIVSTYFYAQQKDKPFLKNDISFSQFVHSLYINPNFTHELDGYLLQPQFSFVCDPNGKLYTDFVGKYESLHLDLDKVCDLLNIDKLNLKMTNKSNHTLYSSYYTDKTRLMVGKLYEKDIELFKYIF